MASARPRGIRVVRGHEDRPRSQKAVKDAASEDRVKEPNNELGPDRNTEATWLQRLYRSYRAAKRALQMRGCRLAASHRVESQTLLRWRWQPQFRCGRHLSG